MNGPKHPMAERLLREYHAGSRIMTKIEAYAIANEMNALCARIKELEDAGASLVKQVLRKHP